MYRSTQQGLLTEISLGAFSQGTSLSDRGADSVVAGPQMAERPRANNCGIFSNSSMHLSILIKDSLSLIKPYYF